MFDYKEQRLLMVGSLRAGMEVTGGRGVITDIVCNEGDSFLSTSYDVWVDDVPHYGVPADMTLEVLA